MAESHRPTLVGRVASNKMQKTVVVVVETRKRHPLYQRMIRRTKRVKAHDEANACQIGDLVRIEQTRPLSKEKHWRVTEILERARVAPPVEEV
ncbi:MAG TPA: 30S ribosomal protein S17 [Chloroflexota bacterium]|jgi:small subunit ribosomal protein S17|nr:30S ribosomal protein S17 [Chloroflexota bacterium]